MECSLAQEWFSYFHSCQVRRIDQQSSWILATSCDLPTLRLHSCESIKHRKIVFHVNFKRRFISSEKNKLPKSDFKMITCLTRDLLSRNSSGSNVNIQQFSHEIASFFMFRSPHLTTSWAILFETAWQWTFQNSVYTLQWRSSPERLQHLTHGHFSKLDRYAFCELKTRRKESRLIFFG